MIKDIETFNQIKDYLKNNQITKNEYMNFTKISKIFNTSYNKAKKYSLLALEENKKTNQ